MIKSHTPPPMLDQRSTRPDVLPAGDYQVCLRQVEPRQAAAGHTYVRLTLEILGGPNAGQRVFDTLSLTHPRAEVADMAQQKFAAYLEAAGLPETTTQSPEVLQGHKMHAKISHRLNAARNDLRPHVRRVYGAHVPPLPPVSSPVSPRAASVVGGCAHD